MSTAGDVVASPGLLPFTDNERIGQREYGARLVLRQSALLNSLIGQFHHRTCAASRAVSQTIHCPPFTPNPRTTARTSAEDIFCSFARVLPVSCERLLYDRFRVHTRCAMSAVENRSVTTRPGGATGRGFMPGQSGNPGGRPKGLPRRVRELVGDDGELILQFMVEVIADESARTADRLEAAKWLATVASVGRFRRSRSMSPSIVGECAGAAPERGSRTIPRGPEEASTGGHSHPPALPAADR